MMVARTVLSAFLAVAIAMAPVTYAWASSTASAAIGQSGPDAPPIAHDQPRSAVHHGHHDHHAMGGHADAPMPDCASMTKAAPAGHDCPHCDIDKSCSVLSCLAKCFQMTGLVDVAIALIVIQPHALRAGESAHPADWSDQPQPPPPRA